MGKLSDHMLVVCFALLALLTFSGCSAIYQQVVASARQPGEQVAATPDQVWHDFNCSKRDRPFVHVESMEVLPEMIKPGGRVNYRLIYVMCPVKPSEVIKTVVSRRMLFKGEQVARNLNEAFELKPGRWVVDSFFTLPTNSPLGVYSLEVGFEAPNGHAHRKTRSFVVSNEFYLSGQ
jgi:hypothetical protein